MRNTARVPQGTNRRRTGEVSPQQQISAVVADFYLQEAKTPAPCVPLRSS
ncbi:uncharacterized protein PHALS_00198 [Plasmopara halstedii]|uniref:Uncharacterized protein n=1 Tax=Plasmopara halstedii TaxID=4781 RepID=A0A0P1A711_PLAHL|nr:uncharacterized protein PHALS_00198 [Plasmopara halstedii]CEG35870.1 hypothetical protein PHALS_00198 [Plasmopara halstedii]|eukprot:XP_024572239.1 hypothetical protein PHALS_00198 [Plasmopara halstedii]